MFLKIKINMLKKLFLFDCEWVPIVKNYDELSKFPTLKDAWNRRCTKWNDDKKKKREPEMTPSEYWDVDAHWHAEFNKMVCISFGYHTAAGEFKTNSIYGHDETEILTLFNKLLLSVEKRNYILSGYAIKRFDMPWTAKRMMINGIKPSKLLNVYGQKPWDVNVYDLPEVWGMGCNQENYTPFDWATVALGIETSKNDIGGADVKRVYYEEGDAGLERIKTYCEKDVTVSYELAKKLLELS